MREAVPAPAIQERLSSLSRGFMEPRVLLTAAELDLFTLLAVLPLSAAEVAKETGGDVRAVTLLLDALVALDLLEKGDGGYATPASLAPFLVAGSPDSILPSVLHAANLWNRWGELTRRAGGVRGPAAAEGSDLAAFIGAMHVIARGQADRIVAAAGPGGATNLVDVGGASGTYTLAFLRAAPGMRATLFDLPSVVGLARERFAEAGVLDRVTLSGGDFLVDPIPGGHDLAFVSAIIHQNGPEENDALYRNVLGALVPGGRIVIRDHVMDETRTRPRAGALFALNMLVGTRHGATYTFREIAEGLARAGFARARLVADGERMDALVEAFRP